MVVTGMGRALVALRTRPRDAFFRRLRPMRDSPTLGRAVSPPLQAPRSPLGVNAGEKSTYGSEQPTLAPFDMET